MDFLAKIYTIISNEFLPIICFFIALIFGSYYFSKFSYKDSGVDGIFRKIFGNSIIRTITVSFLLCFFVFFCNNDFYQLFGGKDIRFLSDGRYCYNVLISRCDGNDKAYTLPASVYKYTENRKTKYYIEKVYFDNGGYLVFDDEDDFVFSFDDTDWFYDQNGEEWYVELKNQKSIHKSIIESKSITVISTVLTIIQVMIIMLGCIEHISKIKTECNTKSTITN